MRHDKPEVEKEVNLKSTSSGGVDNNSIFLDSADNIIKTKDNSGVINIINGGIVLFDSNKTMSAGDNTITLAATNSTRIEIFITAISGTVIPRLKVNAISAYLTQYMDLDSSPSFTPITTSITDGARTLGVGGTAKISLWVNNSNIYSNGTFVTTAVGMNITGGVTDSGTHTTITALVYNAVSTEVVNIRAIGFVE